MKRRGVHTVPDFSRKSGPKLKDAPAVPVVTDQKSGSQRAAPPAPKPHATSSKSGRRGT